MRIGLAGTGRIGTFHAATLADLDGVGSLVLADADPARARAVAERLTDPSGDLRDGAGGTGPGRRAAVEHVDAVEALFSAGLDGLVVAAATAAHAPLLLAAVDAGLPVFCEKPVAADVVSTVAVLDRVRAAGARVHIGFQRRFDAGYAAARAAVTSGELGRIHTVRAGTLDAAPPPPEYVPTSGGFFRDCTVHDVDAIRWVTGHEVVEAYATGSARGAAYFAEAGDVDAVAALLTLDDGTFAHIMGSRYNARGYDVRMEVLGTADGIGVGLDDRLPLRSVEPGVTFPGGAPYPMFLDRFAPAYRAELAHFTAMVAGRAEPACTVADALAAVLVAEACELSRHLHRPVTLEEVRP